MRLFIAQNLADQQKKSVEHLQQKIHRHLDGTKWVSPAAMHLTLAFLGEVQTERVPSVIEAIQAAAAGTEPFFCSYGGGGVFPAPHKAKVIWLGLLSGSEAVHTLASGLSAALAEKGFIIESRSFAPHLTLGRLRYSLAVDKIINFLEEARSFATVTARIEQITLYMSRLTRQGAVHTAVQEIKLGRISDDLAGN